MRQSKGNYEFYNANPKNRLNASDCVYRAISLALDITWEEALKELVEIALKLKYSPNSDKVIEVYLKEKGYVKEKQPRKVDNKKYTTYEFAQEENIGTYIIRQAHHLTVVKDGLIYDTWDCQRKSVGNYWKIK